MNRPHSNSLPLVVRIREIGSGLPLWVMGLELLLGCLFSGQSRSLSPSLACLLLLPLLNATVRFVGYRALTLFVVFILFSAAGIRTPPVTTLNPPQAILWCAPFVQIIILLAGVPRRHRELLRLLGTAGGIACAGLAYQAADASPAPWLVESAGTALLILSFLQTDPPAGSEGGRTTVTERDSFRSWMRAAVLTGIVALSLTAAGLLSPHMGPPYARLRQWIEQRLPLRSPAAERTVPGMPPVAPQQNAAADDRPEAGLGCDLGLSPSSTHERCLQLSINRDGARRREKGERIYVRCSAYDRFSGRGWSSSRASRRTVRDIDDGARDGRIRLRRATINEVSCSIIRLGEQGNIVPTIPTVITLQLESAEQDGNDNLFSSLISTNETAAICSMVSSDVRWTDLNPSQRVTGRTAAVYSRLPDDALSRRVRAMVREWAGSEDHPGAIADRILERLRSEYEYASDIKHPTGTNPLEDFLFKARKGDCRFFASGLALALRAASIPSRLASGYCGGEYDPETKLYTFFTDDAHAWVEVYVEGFGWVLIDPTPPVAGAPSAPREARSTIHADTTGTNKAGKQADSRENASGKTETGRWIPGRSLGPWIGGMTMLLAVVIFLVVRSLASWAARRDEERRYGTCRKPNYFRLFCSHYARRGMPIRKGQTAREYLNALKQHGLVGDDCDPLVDYFERTAYGQFPSSPMAESRFKSLVHHLQNRQPPPARG